MKNQWTIWALVGCVVVSIFFIVNYQSRKEVVSMGELFPETNNTPPIQYEFVDSSNQPVQESAKEDAESTGNVSTATTAATTASAQNTIALQSLQLKPASVPPAARSTQTLTIEKTEKSFSRPDFASTPFTIQAASFKDKVKAELSLAGMKAAGYQAYMAATDLKEKGTWYRIYIGSFTSKAQADQFLTELKQKPTYKDSFVITTK